MNGIFADVTDIREYFADLLRAENFVEDKSGCKMLEMIGASFIANDDHIFGVPNEDYINREIEWYNSQSLSVDHIPGETPKIWKQVSDSNGFINSNYGWCLFSPENGFQINWVVKHLTAKADTRQAVAIYTRPSMHVDATARGKSDFMCTNTVQYVIRDGQLNAIVQMRSNDAWAGYRNDVAWQYAALKTVADEYNARSETAVQPGVIVWQVGSLHVYERNFWLVDHFGRTGETKPKKEDYDGPL